jgi:tRNA threonylcarbamoyl adenosine modification protein (Sua5/YciO/YrdC/YwlC family)
MEASLITINPDNIDQRKIQDVLHVINSSGVIVYPTDSVYGICCNMDDKKAIEKLCRIKKIDPDKAKLTLICDSFSMVSLYSKGLDTAHYRMLKRNTPGPFTFILKASSNLPASLGKRKTIGFRIPENKIAIALVSALGKPLVSLSLHNEDDDIQEYFSDPEEIFQRYHNQVDAIIDGGIGQLFTSGIIDISNDDVEILRPGIKDLI